ncbi:hypothetical protein D9M68_825040 [compost metagenome]
MSPIAPTGKCGSWAGLRPGPTKLLVVPFTSSRPGIFSVMFIPSSSMLVCPPLSVIFCCASTWISSLLLVTVKPSLASHSSSSVCACTLTGPSCATTWMPPLWL